MVELAFASQIMLWCGIVSFGGCMGVLAWTLWRQQHRTTRSLVEILSRNHSLKMSADFAQYLLEKESQTGTKYWTMTSIDTNELKRSSGAELDVNQEKKLSRCARDVVRVTLLGESLRERTRIPFDDTNPDHLAVLKSLWEAHREEPFEIPSPLWSEFGFQGKNPATDFRAGGLLSAQNIATFGTHYPNAYKRSLQLANADKTYAPHAVVGIHVTMFILDLFKEGFLHRHFLFTEITEEEYNRIYCYLFYKLILYWVASNPANIFEYNAVEKKFFDEVREGIHRRHGLVYLPSEIDRAFPNEP